MNPGSMAKQPIGFNTSPNRKYILSYLDVVLAATGSIIIGVLLARYAPGGPLSTDITVYMNAGINHVENVFILNRYFHIILEAIFLKAAPTPLIGFQEYWAFLLTATAFLVYYNARSFSGHSNFIHGILAVGIFFSIKYFASVSGIAEVDTTAMFMVMVLITVYMASARRQHQIKWILILLGLFFYLALKTKETTLVFGLMFIGFGFSGSKVRSKGFLKNILYLVVGILAGILVFAILNWIIIKDPFFELRPMEYYNYFITYVRGSSGLSLQQAAPGNWYTTYLLQAIYIPFILYILSGLKTGTEIDSSHRLVWWLPLSLTIFVSLSASVTWGIRLLMPAIPIICMLAPQFLNLEVPESGQERLKAGILAIVGILILVIIRIVMRYVLPRIGRDPSLFLDNVYEPAILSTILAISFFWKRYSLTHSIFVVVLIIALLISPLIANIKTMVRDHPNQSLSQRMFYPYSAFAKDIDYTPRMKMLVSLNAWQAVGMPNYCENIDDALDLFNIYFDASSTRSNFTIDTDPVSIAVDIIESDYDYALISTGDWKYISSDVLLTNAIKDKYQFQLEPKNLVILLILK